VQASGVGDVREKRRAGERADEPRAVSEGRGCVTTPFVAVFDQGVPRNASSARPATGPDSFADQLSRC
jgi:hypothetical protein